MLCTPLRNLIVFPSVLFTEFFFGVTLVLFERCVTHQQSVLTGPLWSLPFAPQCPHVSLCWLSFWTLNPLEEGSAFPLWGAPCPVGAQALSKRLVGATAIQVIHNRHKSPGVAEVKGEPPLDLSQDVSFPASEKPIRAFVFGSVTYCHESLDSSCWPSATQTLSA